MLATPALLLVLAAVAAPDVVKLDPETGLWFPPDRSRSAYLSGHDPTHNYGTDVTKALREDPGLARTVCSLFVADDKTRAIGTLAPRVRQLRTMLGMICVAIRWEEANAVRERENPAEIRKRLEALYERAQRVDPIVATLDGEQLDQRMESMTLEERVVTALAVVSLRPSNSYPVMLLIREVSRAGWAITPTAAQLGVAEFMGRRAAAERLTNWHWLSGHRWALFLGGDFAAARAVTQEMAPHRDEEGLALDAVLLALIDRIDGEPAAFRQAIRRCPPPSQEKIDSFYGYDDPELHCRIWLQPIVLRTVNLLGAEAPGPLRELLREHATSPWSILAVNATADLMELEPDFARKSFEELLRRETLPPGIRLDALGGLATLALKRGDFAAAIPLIRCRLDGFGLLLPFEAKLWDVLAEAPAVTAAKRDEMSDRMEGRSSEWYAAAHESGNHAEMRRSIEALLAYSAATKGDLSLVRDRLTLLALDEAKGGRTGESARAYHYLGRQKLTSVQREKLREVERLLGESAHSSEPPRTPWDHAAPTDPLCP